MEVVDDEISKMHDYLSKFNQLLILKDTLYKNNFNIVEFIKTRENITISTDEQTKTIIVSFPLRFLNEKGKCNHIRKKFKAIIRDELDDDKTVIREYDMGYGVVYSETVTLTCKWSNFDDRREIIHTILWIFYKKVTQRIQALWDGDIKDHKNDENILYDFNLSWLNMEKNIKLVNEDWIKCKNMNRQIFVGGWELEKFITKEEANNLKDLDVFMGENLKKAKKE
jgi:hypothetical protein